MRPAFLFIMFLALISCKNSNSNDSSNSDSSADSSSKTDVTQIVESPYTAEPDQTDSTILIIKDTKILDGVLDASTNMITYRVKGSTSKEMVIQLMAQNLDIYFNLRVEGGETIAEKQRKYMFTVASGEVLVIDVTSDKPLTEKAIINTIITQI